MIVVVMGVAGAGKTTIGALLAARLAWPFLDGDDFHPPANRAKMQAGQPLDDDDRRPWLAAINAMLLEQSRAGRSVVLACSALKQRYRDWLAADVPDLRFVYLRGSRALVGERLGDRRGHFMPATLLDSQFAALEEPADAIVIEVDRPPQELVRLIAAAIGVQ